MNAASWVPSTIVLAVGLIVGLWAAWRLRHRAPHEEAHAARARDLELQIEDLEVRRDDYYHRLRGETARPLGERDRPRMEIAAARILRDLDLRQAELEKLVPGTAKAEAAPNVSALASAPEPAPVPAPASAPAEAPRGFAARHPLLVGFASGAGMVGLVGLLVFWALQDARPGPRMAPQPGGAGSAAGGLTDLPPGAHPEDFGEVEPAVAEQIAALEGQVASQPEDLGARKELAVTLLSHNQFLRAFEQAREILAVAPEDPDGLYVVAVVRLTMGQAETTVEILDRVLQRFPQHVLAHVVRGMALVQLGDAEAAVRSWERGLEAAGGSHPEIEQLIAEVRGDAGLAPPPRGASATTTDEDDDGTPRVYELEIELAPGIEAPPGAVLFVALQDPRRPGQPAAVRRIADPTFPVRLQLDASDSMAGLANLPASGQLVVWIDVDGDMAPRGPGELSAQASARHDRKATFVLR